MIDQPSETLTLPHTLGVINQPIKTPTLSLVVIDPPIDIPTNPALEVLCPNLWWVIDYPTETPTQPHPLGILPPLQGVIDQPSETLTHPWEILLSHPYPYTI